MFWRGERLGLGNADRAICARDRRSLRDDIDVSAIDDLQNRTPYPRSSTYDADWLLSLDMGPNPLWLLEDLATDMGLESGMRVLDLGCGKGATSVFLAREFGVRVVAADLWIPAEERAAVFSTAGVDDLVDAVNANALDLPFALEEFDAIISIDSWEYFGTSDRYVPYLARFLRPGGELGVATPALRREVRDLGTIPPHIKAAAGWEAMSWHTPEWYRFQWEITDMVEVTTARFQDRGWDDWLRWNRALLHKAVRDGAPQASIDHMALSLEMHEQDAGELMTFALLVAKKLPGVHSLTLAG
jgi:SAM-dependent methyltransferase